MVAQTGGLSAAASMLGIPQSLVTRRIQALEKICGGPLLYRHGRGVKLTPAGENLHQHLPSLMSHLASVVNGTTALQSNVAGTVTIAISPSLLACMGLQLLQEVRSKLPDIHLVVLSGHSRYVHEWLLQSRVDIGLLSDLKLSSPLLTEDLGAPDIVLAASPTFPLPGAHSAGNSIPLADLEGIPLIIPSLALRRAVTEAATSQGIELRFAFDIDNVELTKDVTTTGAAAMLLTRLGVAREIERGEFIERRLVLPSLKTPFVLATAKNSPLTPAIKAVVRVSKALAKQVIKKFG